MGAMPNVTVRAVIDRGFVPAPHPSALATADLI
jgi:hypothetical protein